MEVILPEPNSDGRYVFADGSYIRRSLNFPEKWVVFLSIFGRLIWKRGRVEYFLTPEAAAMDLMAKGFGPGKAATTTGQPATAMPVGSPPPLPPPPLPPPTPIDLSAVSLPDLAREIARRSVRDDGWSFGGVKVEVMRYADVKTV